MGWVVLFSVASFAFYAWALHRCGLSPLDGLVLLPWPLAIVLASLFGGTALYAYAVHGGSQIPPHPGLGLVLPIVGAFALLSGIALSIRNRTNEARTLANPPPPTGPRITVPAVVKSFARTGTTMNDIPQVAITVTATDNGKTFEATVRKFVDPLHGQHIQTGAAAHLVYIPNHLDHSELYLGYETPPTLR